ncbi:hypothetical protein DFH27DRAFT_566855 [Peziza echinospora]|nr:hypothetical protein DFH27DRAFT_566855 [Peziza echinospora]
MHFSSKFFSSALAALSLLQVSSQAPLERRQTTKEDPCTKVGKIYATGNPKVPAELAYECLKNVPFNSTQAVFITQQARTFSRVLSYQAFYNKPENLGLAIDRVDLNTTLNSIEARAKRSDGYDSEYSFNRALAELFGRYHDGHTVFLVHSLVALGSFVHDYPLAAVVQPGERQPRIYIANPENGTIGQEVIEIAGKPALQHLMGLTTSLNGHTDASWVDADTRWNKLFVDRQIDGIYSGNFANRDFYPGRSFSMKLANKTDVTVEWYALHAAGSAVKDYAGTYNTTETYKKYFLAPPVAKNGTNGTATSSTGLPYPYDVSKTELIQRRKLATVPGVILKNIPPAAYPPVVHRTKASEQTLHILNNSSIAVWSFSTFYSRSHGVSGGTPDEKNAFFLYWRQHMEETFAILKARGIKKLILDFSNNGGGRVTLGYETIRAFFPSAKPFFGMDFRRTPAVDTYVDYLDTLDSFTKIDGERFPSFDEILGPVNKYGDSFTNITRPSVKDSIKGELPNVEFNQTGNGMFSVDDIIFVTDGACGSTCVIVHEALSELGVASVAVGGRPVDSKVNKTMQAVGGVKGYEVASYSTFQTWGLIPEFKDIAEYFPKALPVQFTSQMNLRNSYEIHDLTVPLEFKYQPAEGHMYYTKEMIADRTKLWIEAANMAWDKDGKNLLKGKSPVKSDGKQPDALKFSKRSEGMLEGLAKVMKSRARV